MIYRGPGEEEIDGERRRNAGRGGRSMERAATLLNFTQNLWQKRKGLLRYEINLKNQVRKKKKKKKGRKKKKKEKKRKRKYASVTK